VTSELAPVGEAKSGWVRACEHDAVAGAGARLSQVEVRGVSWELTRSSSRIWAEFLLRRTVGTKVRWWLLVMLSGSCPMSKWSSWSQNLAPEVTSHYQGDLASDWSLVLPSLRLVITMVTQPESLLFDLNVSTPKWGQEFPERA